MDDDLLALITAAYSEAKTEGGFASLSQVGQIAGNRSSFDVRNHGFKSLTEMVESFGSFAVERRDGGHVWIKRLR